MQLTVTLTVFVWLLCFRCINVFYRDLNIRNTCNVWKLKQVVFHFLRSFQMYRSFLCKNKLLFKNLSQSFFLQICENNVDIFFSSTIS